MRYRNTKTGAVMDFASLISSPDWVAVDKPAAQSPGTESTQEQPKKRGRQKKG